MKEMKDTDMEKRHYPTATLTKACTIVAREMVRELTGKLTMYNIIVSLQHYTVLLAIFTMYNNHYKVYIHLVSDSA